MYAGKKVIVIIGKTASGKTYITKLLNKETNAFGIDLDKEISRIIPYRKRKKILETKGIKELEKYVYPILRKHVLRFFFTCSKPSSTFVICGVNADKIFEDILDITITCTASYNTRKKRALKRGNSLEQFKFYNSLGGK